MITHELTILAAVGQSSASTAVETPSIHEARPGGGGGVRKSLQLQNIRERSSCLSTTHFKLWFVYTAQFQMWFTTIIILVHFQFSSLKVDKFVTSNELCSKSRMANL